MGDAGGKIDVNGVKWHKMPRAFAYMEFFS